MNIQDITAATLIDMCAKFAGDDSATWMMSPKIFEKVRKLRDSSSKLIYHDSLFGNCLPTLLGIPVAVDAAFDDIKIIGRMPREYRHDPIEHPKHYTSHPSGVECIQITEHMGFNLGNVIKYLWRAEEKGQPIEDLEKAAWCLAREIQKRRKAVQP